MVGEVLLADAALRKQSVVMKEVPGWDSSSRTMHGYWRGV